MPPQLPGELATEAELLAQSFYRLSQAVDDFRLNNWDVLKGEDRSRLKAQAQALATRAHELTAAVMGAILRRIQPDLPAIKQATSDARNALNDLSDVRKGISIVDAAVALVGAIAAGDFTSIVGNVEGLRLAVTSG
jgi:hypothetical protein